MQMSLTANKEGMAEFFNSEDNSSSEEEFVEKVNTVEISKGGGELVGKDCHGVLVGLLTWVQGSKDMLWISAPLTTFSWVFEGSQGYFFIIDILGKVVDS